MGTDSRISKVVRLSIVAGSLLFAAGFTSVADAAQGCGYGWHRNMYGGCGANHPGPNSTPAPEHPGCWRNGWGQLRCY